MTTRKVNAACPFFIATTWHASIIPHVVLSSHGVPVQCPLPYSYEYTVCVGLPVFVCAGHVSSCLALTRSLVQANPRIVSTTAWLTSVQKATPSKVAHRSYAPFGRRRTEHLPCKVVKSGLLLYWSDLLIMTILRTGNSRSMIARRTKLSHVSRVGF